MDELEKLNAALTGEADTILHEHGLLTALGKYGSPVVVGSHALGLMVRRDLDINLDCNEITVAGAFQLGQEIAQCLKSPRMQYLNEFYRRTPNLPTGLYWGVHTGALNLPDVWNLDIWALEAQEMELQQRGPDDLKSRITSDNRPAILAIKHQFCQHPQYGRIFNGMDVYRAVLNDGVETVDGFSRWLQENGKAG